MFRKALIGTRMTAARSTCSLSTAATRWGPDDWSFFQSLRRTRRARGLRRAGWRFCSPTELPAWDRNCSKHWRRSPEGDGWAGSLCTLLSRRSTSTRSGVTSRWVPSFRRPACPTWKCTRRPRADFRFPASAAAVARQGSVLGGRLRGFRPADRVPEGDIGPRFPLAECFDRLVERSRARVEWLVGDFLELRQNVLASSFKDSDQVLDVVGQSII